MISPRAIFLFFLLLFSIAGNSQADSLAADSLVSEEEGPVVKDTVKVGVYITSIYSLGFAENDFGIDF